MSTITTVNTYATTEVPDSVLEKQADFFRLHGWDKLEGSAEVMSAFRRNVLMYSGCGHNASRLMAAARRDKRDFHDLPRGHWVGEDWVPAPTEITTAKPKRVQQPAAVKSLPDTTDYRARWLEEIKTTAQLKAELAYLTGLLSRNGISAVRKVA